MPKKPSKEQINEARLATKKITGAFPDYGKVSPEYGVSLLEGLSYLSVEQIRQVVDPETGILVRCKYLPTIADIHELLRETERRRTQFDPAPTYWKRFSDEPEAPWNTENDFERRKRVVIEQLGYNPAKKVQPKRIPLIEPTEDEIRAVKLTHPASPPSVHLKKLLVEQGFLSARVIESDHAQSEKESKKGDEG